MYGVKDCITLHYVKIFMELCKLKMPSSVTEGTHFHKSISGTPCNTGLHVNGGYGLKHAHEHFLHRISKCVVCLVSYWRVKLYDAVSINCLNQIATHNNVFVENAACIDSRQV